MSLSEKLSNLPTKPGCYLFKDKDDNVLYVGKTVILRNRVKSYFQKRPLEPRLQAMVSKIYDVEVFVVDSEMEALILENNLIKDRKPRFNVNLKDDNFCYLLSFTSHSSIKMPLELLGCTNAMRFPSAPSRGCSSINLNPLFLSCCSVSDRFSTL